MIVATLSILINRPIEDVLAVLGDDAKAPLWNTLIEEMTLVKGKKYEVGCQHLHQALFLGKRMEILLELTEFVQDKKMTLKAAKPFPQEYHWDFERVPEGTRVNLKITAEPEGFFKLAGLLIEASAKRSWQANLENLKALVEAPVATPV